MKKSHVRWVDFDKDENNGSLTRKVRPAFIMNPHNGKAVFVVPLTSVEKPYNQKNKFAVKLSTGAYALCDQFEQTGLDDQRLLEEARITLSKQDETNIMLTLEEYMSLSVNKKLPMQYNSSLNQDLKLGDTVSFKEEIRGGIREIVGVITAIDDSISITRDDDYVLMHVQSVRGKSEDFVLKNRTALIRTRRDLVKGMMLQAERTINNAIDIAL